MERGGGIIEEGKETSSVPRDVIDCQGREREKRYLSASVFSLRETKSLQLTMDNVSGRTGCRCRRWHVYGCGSKFWRIGREEGRREAERVRIDLVCLPAMWGRAIPSTSSLPLPHPFCDCARTFSTGNCQIECRVRPPKILLEETASWRSFMAMGSVEHYVGVKGGFET